MSTASRMESRGVLGRDPGRGGHNALKFTPAGGTVVLALRAETGWARAWVSDTGIRRGGSRFELALPLA